MASTSLYGHVALWSNLHCQHCPFRIFYSSKENKQKRILVNDVPQKQNDVQKYNLQKILFCYKSHCIIHIKLQILKQVIKFFEVCSFWPWVDWPSRSGRKKRIWSQWAKSQSVFKKRDLSFLSFWVTLKGVQKISKPFTDCLHSHQGTRPRGVHPSEANLCQQDTEHLPVGDS